MRCGQLSFLLSPPLVPPLPPATCTIIIYLSLSLSSLHIHVGSSSSYFCRLALTVSHALFSNENVVPGAIFPAGDDGPPPPVSGRTTLKSLLFIPKTGTEVCLFKVPTVSCVVSRRVWTKMNTARGSASTRPPIRNGTVICSTQRLCFLNRFFFILSSFFFDGFLRNGLYFLQLKGCDFVTYCHLGLLVFHHKKHVIRLLPPGSLCFSP